MMRFGHTIRFIPACVGNSAVWLNAPGSSPRVWGTHQKNPIEPRNCRFIPACVGNSALLSVRHHWPPVHPRVCGELAYCIKANGEITGSSPRVWGTHNIPQKVNWINRFIPACVGNSSTRFSLTRRTPVHPRVCGTPRIFNEAPPASPRVWGTALAGTVLLLSSVHPRVCGELRGVPLPSMPKHGSSPRVWGTLGGAVIANKTTVHPRVCGELTIRPRIPRL